MNSTNEKVELATETEIAATEIPTTEITDTGMTDTETVYTKIADTEVIEGKSSAQGLPDYEEATESKDKDAEELSVPEFRSQTPTEIFAATESSTYPPQPVTHQPQTVQPGGHHVRVHPGPVVAVVAPVAPAIHTSCCECDGPWCGFCCCGVCCHICTGMSLNQKITGKSGIWGWDLLVYMIFIIFFSISMTLAVANEEFICYDYYGCYWKEDNGKVWSIMAFVSMIILMLASILRIYTRFAQRRLFLQKQAQKGHLPNNEGCIASFFLTWFCSPCMFGQMNSAIEKQRLLSSMQPQHTVSYA